MAYPRSNRMHLQVTPTRLALAVRILIALSTRTFFQPDEYFQSLEPAHHAVFGYGHLTWEWLTPKPIRSIFYPAFNIPIYWILKISGISELAVIGDWFLIYCPRILHGTLAAATDIWLCKVTRQWLGVRYISTALLLSLTSFFHALSLSRSLSNSLETSLTIIAFTYYPWDASSSLSPQLMFNRTRMTRMLIFSALSCVVRPTNAVIWLYLFGNLLWALRFNRRIAAVILSQVLIVGTIALLLILILDSLYYKGLTFTPLNFLLTNLSPVSQFYGSTPWHYYFTQALPILCTTSLPFAFHGMWSVLFDRKAIALRTMLLTIIWSIGIYSLVGHKEWRFIHPILPLLHLFAAKSLVDISSITNKGAAKKKKLPHYTFSQNFLKRFLPIRTSYLGFILLTIPASLYVVLFYCSAPISVLSYIRTLSRDQVTEGTVGFLMPCHSTPGHAYIHREVFSHGKLWALGCEPPLGGQSLTEYRDQTDIFFQSPKDYLHTYFPSEVNPSFPPSPFPTSIPGSLTKISDGPDSRPWAHEWPRYLIFFGALLQQNGVKELFEQKGYKEVWKKGREWEGEGHRKGGVRVWEWQG